jgi:hypothetical protein
LPTYTLVEIHLHEQSFDRREHGRDQFKQLGTGTGHEKFFEPGARLVEALQGLAEGLHVRRADALRRIGLVPDELAERVDAGGQLAEGLCESEE